MLTVRFTDDTYTVARVDENPHADTIKQDARFARFFEGQHRFEVVIANGRAGTTFKRIKGVWHHSTMHVDRCFGIINTRWQPCR